MSDIHDKLYDLLDGALPREQHSEVYSALASDSSLRDEMMDQISIRTAVNSDKRAFVPSPDATAGIMGRLGFAGAGLATQATKPFYLKVLQSTALTATGIVLGFLLGSYFLGGDSESGDTIADNAPISQSRTISSVRDTVYMQGEDRELIKERDNLKSEILSLEREIEKLTNQSSEFLANKQSKVNNSKLTKDIGEKDAKINELERRIKELEDKYYASLEETGMYKEKYLASNSEAEEYREMFENEHRKADELYEKLEAEKTMKPMVINNSPDPSSNSSLFVEPSLLKQENNSAESKHGLTVYVSGSVYGYENGVKIAPVEYSSFNNMALGLGFEIFGSENGDFSLDALAEFRRETFSLHYPIRPGDYQSPMANQQPNFNTASLGARANWLPTSDLGINLFADAMAGPAFSADVMAIGGLVVQPRFGLEYYISASGYITAAASRSFIFYQHEGFNYQNWKNGFTIGMGMDF